jgi:23S rRNA pseudouridine1911/1915/1917 synthase
MNSSGIIKTVIDETLSESSYEVIKSVASTRFEFLNLVKLSPKTGRRHQLRIHLSSIGNQILGDKEYGKSELMLKGNGLYLHASSLAFIHPFTKEEITITKDLPKKFMKIFPSL